MHRSIALKPLLPWQLPRRDPFHSHTPLRRLDGQSNPRCPLGRCHRKQNKWRRHLDPKYRRVCISLRNNLCSLLTLTATPIHNYADAWVRMALTQPGASSPQMSRDEQVEANRQAHERLVKSVESGMRIGIVRLIVGLRCLMS